MRGRVLVTTAAALCASGLEAAPARFTMLHTNDLHSDVHEPGNDATQGGWSRLAAAIAEARAGRQGGWRQLDTSSRNPALCRVVANHYKLTLLLALLAGAAALITRLVRWARRGSVGRGAAT